jgi:hypothetical protein
MEVINANSGPPLNICKVQRETVSTTTLYLFPSLSQLLRDFTKKNMQKPVGKFKLCSLSLQYTPATRSYLGKDLPVGNKRPMKALK